MQEIHLTSAESATAGVIQLAMDAFGESGGRLVLPETDVLLDRGLELRSNVELCGQGKGTVLRKAAGRVYPLSGYHNYGMFDVPLEFTDGLSPGMTVAVRDSAHGGFYETFARITWVDGIWVGLDCPLKADYLADKAPVLVTSFPLVFGRDVENVAVRNLVLDGNRGSQPAGIGACRGAAVYLIRGHNCEISGVEESGFLGEGLGFQMCSQVRILNCRFAYNAGNGYHPGAGSTAARFEGCTAEANDGAGFFFCVRANHITVRNSIFRLNEGCGISVGTRDCHNRIDSCHVADNGGPGILFRPTPRPTEAHSCRVSRCRVERNGAKEGRGQIDILGDAHDLILEANELTGLPDHTKTGIFVATSAERIWLNQNHIDHCFPSIIADPRCLADKEPEFSCGVDAAGPVDWRHLFLHRSPDSVTKR